MSERRDQERPIKVAQVEGGDFEVVLNAGADAYISVGDRFIVYRHGNQIKDPDTGEHLGILEIVVGPGIITHVQERISILRSATKVVTPTKIVKRQGILSMLEATETRHQTEEIPFNNPKIGDLAKRV